jgi:hypothetical protein
LGLFHERNAACGLASPTIRKELSGVVAWRNISRNPWLRRAAKKLRGGRKYLPNPGFRTLINIDIDIDIDIDIEF